MKAIILAAGKGIRLLPLTQNTPKPLLDIGEGQTIIENQLKSIIESGGIDEVIYVIGYRAEQIEAKMHMYTDIPLRFLYNPFYATTNNLISVWIAIDEMNDDFIIINGDDLFKPKVLKNLVDQPKDVCISLVISRKDEYGEDDMKVITKNDRILKVSKLISPKEANGESIGMMRFSGRGIQIMQDTINTMVREEENKNTFYLAAIQQIIDSGFAVNFSECSNDDWAEIDFHPDLKTLRNNFKKKFHKKGK